MGDQAPPSIEDSKTYARPWWALRTASVYGGAKRIYLYTTSFRGAWCLARFGENTAEGALQLTGVKGRLHLEEPKDAGDSSWYKRTPNISTIDYNLDKGLHNLDDWIDARLSSPETVEGRLVRYGTSWGVWVAEKLPFGSETVIKVIDDINPERKASVASVSEQADPVESPVPAAEGAEEATDSTTTTINSKDSVNTEEGKAEEAAESLTEVGPEEDGVDDLENEEVMEGDGMVTAPSSTSLASQGEADESGETAGKKDGKKGKGKARRLLRSMGNSFKKAINFPKSPHTSTPQEDDSSVTASASPARVAAPQSHFPITPKAVADPNNNNTTSVTTTVDGSN